MNRRDFIKGLVALPVVAQVGAVERFLVGRYGGPVATTWAMVGVAAAVIATFAVDRFTRDAGHRLSMEWMVREGPKMLGSAK